MQHQHAAVGVAPQRAASAIHRCHRFHPRHDLLLQQVQERIGTAVAATGDHVGLGGLTAGATRRVIVGAAVGVDAQVVVVADEGDQRRPRRLRQCFQLRCAGFHQRGVAIQQVGHREPAGGRGYIRYRHLDPVVALPVVRIQHKPFEAVARCAGIGHGLADPLRQVRLRSGRHGHGDRAEQQQGRQPPHHHSHRAVAVTVRPLPNQHEEMPVQVVTKRLSARLPMFSDISRLAWLTWERSKRIAASHSV